ncbi:MAG TPA: hypothetical protein ENI45_00865 [Thermoplasmatales archaeon]|nr:hypothetical protein [Thermoplasmatales archaeon]
MRLSISSLAVLICTIVLAILLCIPTNSLILCIIPNENCQRENTFPSDTVSLDEKLISEKNVLTILKHVRAEQSKTGMQKKGFYFTVNNPSPEKNICVSPQDSCNLHPSMAVYKQNNLLVAYLHRETTEDIYIQRSADGGITWSQVFYSLGPKEFNHPFSTTNQSNPEVAIKPNGYGFCVFESDDNRSRLYMLEFPEIHDETTWFVSWFNLFHLRSKKGYQYHVDEISFPSISASTDNKIVIACTADITNITKGVTYHQIPLILYSIDGGDEFTLIFSEDITYQYLSHSSVSSDKGIYIVYQKGTEPVTGIVCFYYPDGVVSSKRMEFIPPTDSYNLLNPDVFTYGDTVFIVAERETAGNYDVILFSSTDSGEHWSNQEVAAKHFEMERYPSIFFNGTRLFCVFNNVSSRNIYLTSSDDFGCTWSKMKQVNTIQSPVHASYHTVQIGDEYNIVWSDLKQSNPLIYYADLEEKTSSSYKNLDVVILPDTVQFTSVNGKQMVKNVNNIVSVTVRNHGNSTAENIMVTVSIRYKDGSKPIPIASKTLPSLNAGEEKKMDIPLFSLVLQEVVPALVEFANIDEIIVTVDPGGKIEGVDEYNSQQSISCSYQDIFPGFSWLEDVVLGFMGEEKAADVSMLEQVLIHVLQEEDDNQVALIESLLS